MIKALLDEGIEQGIELLAPQPEPVAGLGAGWIGGASGSGQNRRGEHGQRSAGSAALEQIAAIEHGSPLTLR